MPALLALAALAAVIYGAVFVPREMQGLSWAASLTKALSTAALAAYGASMGAPALIVAGLALGCLGDLALSRPGQRAFLAGMAAFALGHLAYVLAFRAAALPLPDGPQAVGLVAIAGLALSTEVWLAPRAAPLRAPLRVYTLIIAAMAGFALMLAPAPGRGSLQAGALLFVLSDTLLALRLFVCRTPLVQRRLALLLWPSYWCGQYLILRGSLSALG